MPHHAAELKDRLNFPPRPPLADPCAQRGGTRGLEPHRCALTEAGFRNIVNWMRARIDQRITEEMICARSPMGPRTFRRAFKAHAGLLPMHYLTWLRVDTAVRLLIDTQFDLGEIAFVTGLRSEQGLVSAFSETLGVRPHALRVSLA